MRWTRWMGVTAVVAASIAAAVVASCTATKQPSATSALDPAAKIARGRYLVEVTGCNDCHTPGALYGAPDSTRLLSGSELGWAGPWGTSYPRNLTPDSTGIGSWSEDDIVRAIRTGQRPDGTPLMPPMPWPDFARFTDEDAYAVAAYLKSLPPVSHRNPEHGAPGKKPPGPALVFPPPPAWDVPPARGGGAADTSVKH